LYRRGPNGVEVLLVHPGGPLWALRNDAAWSIPKGEIDEGEDPRDAARREFREETGVAVDGPMAAMDPVRQASGKLVYAWAIEGDADVTTITSNTFSMEWPRGSGIVREFPEVDRAEWFTLAVAARKILRGQRPLLRQLERMLAGGA
jgi:predicted NUDIX family NTP pyrophosphohydrolase